MKDGKVAALISALPAEAAWAGIRAYILHEGLEGDLEEAARALDVVWEGAGHEGIKAELAEFLVARHAYRGNLQAARQLYGRFASLGTDAATLQAQAAALHILACMVMEVKLETAISLWKDFVQRPIPAQFKKLSAPTGLGALCQALKNADSRSAGLVFSALCAFAQETGDEGIAARARKIFEKGMQRVGGEINHPWLF